MSDIVTSSRLIWSLLVLAASSGCNGDTPLLTADQLSDNLAAPTITITSAGVIPKTLTVVQGQRVLFVNNDTVAHEMASDLHPTHERWPALNQVGYLAPGQSRETGNLNTVGVISYHDHLDAQNEGLLGSIRIVPLD